MKLDVTYTSVFLTLCVEKLSFPLYFGHSDQITTPSFPHQGSSSLLFLPLDMPLPEDMHYNSSVISFRISIARSPNSDRKSDTILPDHQFESSELTLAKTAQHSYLPLLDLPSR